MSNEKNKKNEYWRKDVKEIEEDSIHSSQYLADQALMIIETFIRKELYHNRTELLQNLSKLGNALVRAKPLMALIYARAHRVIEFIQNIPKEERDIQVIKQMTLQEIQNIREESEKRKNEITRLGARLIMDQHIVFTHSASSNVESILMEAKRQKKRFQLICTESRPRYEGTKLAQKMAAAGIKTYLIPDADMVRAVEKAHFVLVGADRITENSFINKTGTGAIACVAKILEKPFYIATDSDKILLKRTYPVRFNSVNESELLENPDPDSNLHIQNYYFEEVLLSYVHKVICETSIFETPEFIERFL
ncbi:MAG: initiation factor 2B [Calditrichia bacterium]